MPTPIPLLPPSSVESRVRQLIYASLSLHTKQAYKRSWNRYKEYLAKNNKLFSFPLSEIEIANFIAYLFELNYAPGTITSTISAMAFVHKMMNVEDPSDSFFVKKLMQGCRKTKASAKDGRLPITPSILDKILIASLTTISNQYECYRFHAMCSLAFHALLRIGEMTESQNNLTLDCIHMEREFLTLQFKSYKYSDGAISTHRVNAQPLSVHCPVKNMYRYLAIRGASPGPLFISSGRALTRNQFTKQLQGALRFIGLSSSRYSSHSFRIGSASFMANKGASDAQIKRAARRSSSAFVAYIRINLKV